MNRVAVSAYTYYDSVQDIPRTVFLSFSRASLACSARGMAARHTLQNLALVYVAWKRTAGSDCAR